LTSAEALALFDYLSRFSENPTSVTADSVETKVLDGILCDLEKQLVEPLRPDYDELLLRARREIEAS
jgi:hypothetical protein